MYICIYIDYIIYVDSIISLYIILYKLLNVMGQSLLLSRYVYFIMKY